MAGRELIPLAALTLAAAVLAYPLLVRPNPADLEKKGLQAFNKGDYPAAHSAFRQAVSIEPLSYSHHLSLARVYEATRNYDLAIQELTLAESARAGLGLSDDIKRLDSLWSEPVRLQEEITQLEKLVAARPTYRDGWVGLAYRHYRLKSDQEMKKALDRAYELDPNYEPTLKLRALLPLP